MQITFENIYTLITNYGYINLAQLSEVTESDILKLHGVGPKAVRILNESL
ncbi:hypothetical protein [Bacillus sp. ISL-7]|nr:hypothetical protein [Bacillus sp. ISL-7]MBT2737806.1 hypothetical protein [Bacillus sp. ISL-7]